ncbi:MAG: glycosyltransferase family 2 protein [Eggerthellaceae bacterium]|nr:glycosyltransferase family 2 protein [Eggerthellaceae bacterium]
MMRMPVSVAMAVCNGERYLAAQIDTILSQLNQNDELIVSYDPSNDATLSIVKGYEAADNRVRVIYNHEHSRGLVSNFENALKDCANEIIFYADQDDYWFSNKINRVMKEFDNPEVLVVVHDAKLTDENLHVVNESTFALRGGARDSFIGNLVRLSYIGCCMAFRKEALGYILPLPTKGRSHDWWTGSICCCYGRMAIVDEPLILHRFHTNNATPKKRPGFRYQLVVRVTILFNTAKRRGFAQLIRRRLSSR